MNKIIVTHAVWFAVSLAALGLGWKLKTNATGATANGSGRAAPASKSLRSASPSASGQPGPGAPGAAIRSGDPRAARGGLAAIRNLSDDEIERLGTRFRDSANPIERRLAFSQLLEGLTAENAELIREQIADLPAQSAEFREFHFAWGAVAGKNAVIFGAGTEKADMSPALAGWASADPEAAMTWIKGLDMENDPAFDSLLKGRKLPADGLRRHLMEGVVHGLAVADPTLASQFVHELAAQDQEGVHRMMHGIAEAVLRTASPAEAAEWAAFLPEGDLRTTALARVANRYVGEDPEAAAAWAAGYSDQPAAARVIGEVANNWASKNPEAAVAWLDELPEGDGRNVGMHRALREWAGKDPTAAGEYLQALPASPARDAAIGGYSRRVAWENPRAAMDWAQTIASDGQRLETIIGVGQAWTQKDANGAAQWVAASGLPADVQKAMLTPPRKDRR